MSHSAARARTGHDRTSLYQEITDKIIAELEAGRVPWVQPWGSGGQGAARHAEERRHRAPLFRRQYPDPVGRRHRRGFAGQSLAHLPPGLEPRRQCPQRRTRHDRRLCRPLHARRGTQRAERDGDEPGAIPFLKRFTVFNTDQCEDLPGELVTAPPPVPEG